LAVSYLSITDAAERGVADERASQRRAPPGPVKMPTAGRWKYRV
jgi:hypothetical protein